MKSLIDKQIDLIDSHPCPESNLLIQDIPVPSVGFYLDLLEMMMRLTLMVMDLRSQNLLNGHG